MAVVGFGTLQKYGEKKDKNENPVTAYVMPEDSDGALTLELFIPFEMRRFLKNVQVGEDVLYCVKKDGTGVILSIIPDYTNDVYDDWDYIIRNEKSVLQINGDVRIKGNLTLDKDMMTDGNMLVEGNADILGKLSADGDCVLSQGVEVKGGNTNIGGTIKISGVTGSGSKAFGGFPAGVDPVTGMSVAQDTVNAPPLSGSVASGNKDKYTKAEDNEERQI